MQQKTTDKLVKVAKIVNLHGVKGVVKIKLFIENDALFNKFDIILDEKTTPIPVKLLKKVKDHWLAEIEGVNDCDSAVVFKNKELFVNRASFPELDEDEFYLSDLLGFDVFDMDQKLIGKISAFHAVGEAHLVEIKTTQGELFNIEFSKSAVPHIDLKIKNIVIDVSKKIDLI